MFTFYSGYRVLFLTYLVKLETVVLQRIFSSSKKKKKLQLKMEEKLGATFWNLEGTLTDVWVISVWICDTGEEKASGDR